MSEIAAQPVDPATRLQLLEPFIAATTTALGEMAGVEVFVSSVAQGDAPDLPTDVAAIIELTGATNGLLVFSLPQGTAAALARRVLKDISEEPDDSLIRDCVGEIGNVIAGQAKALLADGPRHFVFSISRRGGADFRPAPGLRRLVIGFHSVQGDFTLQLLLA